MNLRAGFLMAGMIFAASAGPAAAVSAPADYSEAAFAAAQREGRTIVVETYASWCLPCKLQAPILDRLRRQPEFSQLRVFRIGEESPKSDWKRFRLAGYGTLVIFKGKREVGRGNPTSEAAIAKLLRLAG